LGVGDSYLEVLDRVSALLALRVEGDDLLIELLGLRFHCLRVAGSVLRGQFEANLDARRLLGVALAQGEVGVCPGEGLLDSLQEIVGGRTVTDQPVDLAAVFIDKEFGRRPADFVLLVDRVPVLVAATGAVNDEIFVEEVGVFGVVVELLDQQFTAPSATREEIDEDELVVLFGLGQGLVEGAAEDCGRLSGGERGEKEDSGQCGGLSHACLQFRSAYFPARIHDRR
jgi:hypothetical protein